MPRQDIERQHELEPKRIEYAKEKITKLGFEITFESDTRITFMFRGAPVNLFPYSGWHTGSTIKDGRGIEKLLRQLV